MRAIKELTSGLVSATPNRAEITTISLWTCEKVAPLPPEPQLARLTRFNPFFQAFSRQASKALEPTPGRDIDLVCRPLQLPNVGG